MFYKQDLLISEFKGSPVSEFLKALSQLTPKADLLLFSGDYLTGADKTKDFSGSINLLNELAIKQHDYLSDNLQIDFTEVTFSTEHIVTA